MQESAFVTDLPDTATQALNVTPHSIEAEQSVLGGLMLDNTAWDKIADIVNEDDFYRRDHRLIYHAIAQLVEQQDPTDVVTLSDWLDKRNELDKIGGLAYLGKLAKNTPSAANIITYAQIVREKSVLRQLISVGNEISSSCYQTEGRKSEQLLDNAEKLVFEIAEKGAKGRKDFVCIKDLLVKAVDKIDMLFQQDSPITGVPSGFSDFDDMTSGLQSSDMIIVAGRPSMGKTTFAMNIAENVAIKTNLPVAIFSMEMPGEQLAMRLLSSLGRIDQHRVRTGKLDDDDWPRLTSAVGLLAEAKMFIDDTPALTPNELRARARRLAREHDGLGLIVIDYLQLMQVPGTENRVNEISEISRNLKSLAKELSVPVIALSQLNRSLEQRPNKRPVMSDLRESGAIEQDADVIVFIYRDEVYNEESTDKGTAEIIIGKQRNGPIGTVRLTFLGQYTRFENHISQIYEDEGYP
ncbi:MAG: replicative DNA helicase [Gammaproteobacteria bacterium]|jgi:replicative DNA helicase|nr:replicative DNA helicase [Gammaproteobacteria bacterium]